MELHALHKIVLGSLDNLQVATLQHIVKGDGRGVTADDCHPLDALRLIAVNALLGDGVNARHKLNIHRAVRLGGDGLVYAVPRDVELDARYNAVLGSLLDMTCAVGFGVDFQIEIHGVRSSRSHCLLAYAAPDEHIIAARVDILLCRHRHGRGNHPVARKGVLVAVSGYGDAVCGKPHIGHGIVGVREGKAVFLGVGVVFEGIGACPALASCGKARNGVMLCHLG